VAAVAIYDAYGGFYVVVLRVESTRRIGVNRRRPTNTSDQESALV
jgi:hypothetical protein